MKNQKTILIGLVVFVVVALLVYHFNTETVATTDYGITDANIDCDGEYYIFTGTFNTWRIGTHQVQVFCDDDPSNNILNLYVEEVTSSGTYDYHTSRHVDDFNAEMPCDLVWFQLYDADDSVVFFRTEDESVPECIPPIRTPTPPPTATPAPTPPYVYDPPSDDIWIITGVAAFLLLIYFAFRKKPPATPQRRK